MNKLHAELLRMIREHAKEGVPVKHPFQYHGNDHISYNIRVPIHRALIKKWVKDHSDISLNVFLNLLDSLVHGESHQEKTSVGNLLQYMSKFRVQVKSSHIDGWLDHLVGWAEIDSLCQGKFTAKNMNDKWKEWKLLLLQFVKDKNISKRRASLVLLTTPVSQSSELHFAELSFNNIEKLKHEKHILITKAISWLLRSMVKYHKKAVEDYLEKNLTTLPKIAIRETLTKLRSGIKNKRKK